MVQPSISAIPLELISNYILKYLSIHDIINLSQVRKEFKIFDNHIIWRIIEMRLSPNRIIDSSKHIWEPEIDMEGDKSDVCRIVIQYYPVTLSLKKHENWNLLRCLPNNFSYPSWMEYWGGMPINRTHNNYRWGRCGVQDEHIHYQHPTRIYNYVEDLRDRWKNYNNMNGYSVVNLCHCKEHYDPLTLGYKGFKLNYRLLKQFMVLKWWKTKVVINI